MYSAALQSLASDRPDYVGTGRPQGRVKRELALDPDTLGLQS